MYSVDTTNDELDIWLVKVPKYIAQAWKEAPERAELGRLQKTPEGSFKFISNQKVMEQNAAQGSSNHQPGEHKLTLQPITHQRMAIISQTKTSIANGSTQSTTAPTTTATDKTSLEGDIRFKGELKPSGDDSYMTLRASLIKKAAQPSRVTVKIDKALASYKPRGASQLAYEAAERKKKEEAKKFIREDKEIVKERLYKAFEKQQYYNIKDLERVTAQPVNYLKEILKDICKHCSTGTHKNMWELKPEYRHYKT